MRPNKSINTNYLHITFTKYENISAEVAVPVPQWSAQSRNPEVAGSSLVASGGASGVKQ